MQNYEELEKRVSKLEEGLYIKNLVALNLIKDALQALQDQIDLTAEYLDLNKDKK